MATLAGFPFATPYDPSQDPATSVDPLGTAPIAERLAEVLLPGFTARMWRPRLLTMATLASLVGERAAAIEGNVELFDPARLAFERLYVSAIAREVAATPDLIENMRRVPGIARARQAVAKGEPLTLANFLKGQSVNGPTGTMARLTRNLGLSDGENRNTGVGSELAIAWAKDSKIEGVLEDGTSKTWVAKLSAAALEAVHGIWPKSQSYVWSELFARLRPDEIGKHERGVLVSLITHDAVGVRTRFLELLVASVKVFVDHRAEGRVVVERKVLQDGVVPRLGSSVVDKVIRVALSTIEAFQSCSSQLQHAFDVVRWSLSTKGTLHESAVVADKAVATRFENTRRALEASLGELSQSIEAVKHTPEIDQRVVPQLRLLHDDAQAACSTNHALLTSLLDRHRRVQKEKRKGDWIERGRSLTLMPGFGLAEVPGDYKGRYLHPFRIPNAYALLGELDVVEVNIDEED